MVGTKGGGEVGQYDFPIIQAATTWYVVVLDEADRPISPEAATVHYRFRPSSPLCPLAVPLALQIKEAVAQAEGVTGQEIEVVGYVGARALNVLLEEGEED